MFPPLHAPHRFLVLLVSLVPTNTRGSRQMMGRLSFSPRTETRRSSEQSASDFKSRMCCGDRKRFENNICQSLPITRATVAPLASWRRKGSGRVASAQFKRTRLIMQLEPVLLVSGHSSDPCARWRHGSLAQINLSELSNQFTSTAEKCNQQQFVHENHKRFDSFDDRSFT